MSRHAMLRCVTVRQIYRIFIKHMARFEVFLELSILQTHAKKKKKFANNKNLHFYPIKVFIQAIYPTHKLVIFTKFDKDWVKIVDFLIEAYFWANNIFFASVSIIRKCSIAEFSNSVSIIVNIIVTLNYVIVNEQPQCNGHFCWQCELASHAAEV